MTPRQETVLFWAVLFLFGGLMVADAIRNWIRDAVDDYPVWSVVVAVGIGFLVGVAV